jgi:ABC-type multidrug transport system ATPase subunit
MKFLYKKNQAFNERLYASWRNVWQFIQKNINPKLDMLMTSHNFKYVEHVLSRANIIHEDDIRA